MAALGNRVRYVVGLLKWCGWDNARRFIALIASANLIKQG